MIQQTIFWRQQASLILSILLFALFTIIVLLQAVPDEPRPYDLDSADEYGLLALRLWLEEMGYEVKRTGQTAFDLKSNPDLIFVYPNLEPYGEREAQHLYNWVTAGGTLVIIGPDSFDGALIERFNIYDSRVDGFGIEVAQAQPLLPDDQPGSYEMTPLSAVGLDEAPRAVALLSAGDGQATAAIQPFDQGIVWHLSYEHDLTNGKLQDEDLINLVPPLLRDVPTGGTVLFDTYHLYGPIAQAETQISSVREWLYGTYFGWATLFGIVTCFGYLILQGRRLGPPLPMVTAQRPREAAEYVEAMALLHRRARQRTAVVDYQKQRFKIGLGRALHIRSDLDDTMFIQQLQWSNTYIDETIQQQIIDILNALRGDPNETTLVQTAAEIDRLLKEI